MRKLVVTESMTLDGVIDMAQGWFDPLAEDVDQSDLAAADREHQQAADALLVGRNTFVSFREFWPTQRDDPTGVSDYLNAVAKYVVSAAWTIPAGRTPPCCGAGWWMRVQALKQAPGRDIVATGSIQLVHALVAADWSTSTGCSCSRWSPGAVRGCSSRPPSSCGSWRRDRSLRAPFSCGTRRRRSDVRDRIRCAVPLARARRASRVTSVHRSASASAT